MSLVYLTTESSNIVLYIVVTIELVVLIVSAGVAVIMRIQYFQILWPMRNSHCTVSLSSSLSVSPLLFSRVTIVLLSYFFG